MKEPTQEQIKELCEKYEYYGSIPGIDSLEFLGFLFRYIVPKLPWEKIHNQITFMLLSSGKWRCQLGDYGTSDWGSGWQTDIFLVVDEDNPTLALFWTLWKVRNE